MGGNNLICKVCGQEFTKRLFNDDICSIKCSSVDYWNERVKNKDDFIIIDGKCFHDSGNVADNSYSYSLGYGGNRFWILFNDGRTLTTNNLWWNGNIPEEFRNALPDNARFISREEYEKALTAQ